MTGKLMRLIRLAAAPLFRWRLLRRGDDRTVAVTRRSALILAPHADDETIGCGALISRKAAAGTAVTIVIATDGRHAWRSNRMSPDDLAALRRTEAIEAARALGLPETAVRFLDFEDGTLDDNRSALQAALTVLINELAPSELYAPSADEHPDHRTLNEVARQALAESSVAATLYDYLVRYWGQMPWLRSSSNPLRTVYYLMADPVQEWRRPSAMLVKTDGFVERKLEALAVYAGEMEAVGFAVIPFARADYEVFFPARIR